MPSLGLVGASLNEVWQDTAPTDRRAPGRRRSRDSKNNRDRGRGSRATASSPVPPNYTCRQGFASEVGTLCDTYHQNFNSTFDDIMDVYQRDEEYKMTHKRDMGASSRECRKRVDETSYKMPMEADGRVSDGDGDYDTSSDNDSESDVEPEQKPVVSEPPSHKISKPTDSDLPRHADLLASLGEPNWTDLILYVLSGVLLIFILETFVKLGAGMRTARFNFS